MTVITNSDVNLNLVGYLEFGHLGTKVFLSYILAIFFIIYFQNYSISYFLFNIQFHIFYLILNCNAINNHFFHVSDTCGKWVIICRTPLVVGHLVTLTVVSFWATYSRYHQIEAVHSMHKWKTLKYYWFFYRNEFSFGGILSRWKRWRITHKLYKRLYVKFVIDSPAFTHRKYAKNKIHFYNIGKRGIVCYMYRYL